MQSLKALCIGYLLDLCFGDPHWLPHPVKFIGSLINKLEKIIRNKFSKDKNGEILGGLTLVILVISISTFIPFLIIKVLNKINKKLSLIVESIMCYQLLATKSLKVESMKVYDKLRQNDLLGARKAVSMIVGRDTKNLTKEGIAKAAVETIAENTSDGIIAPMFFMALFGAVGGFFYKSVNTMDSMIGYKNKKYINFGKAAAKFDDILNFIPARITAVFMIISSYILKLDYKNAIKVYKTDRKNSNSPNAGQTEAVIAGAFNIQILGDTYYFGKLYHKKTIGKPTNKVTYKHIKVANRLLYVTSFIGILFISIIKTCFITIKNN